MTAVVLTKRQVSIVLLLFMWAVWPMAVGVCYVHLDPQSRLEGRAHRGALGICLKREESRGRSASGLLLQLKMMIRPEAAA